MRLEVCSLRLNLLWIVLDKVLINCWWAKVCLSWITNELLLSSLSLTCLLERISESIWRSILNWFHVGASPWIRLSWILNSWSVCNISRIWSMKTPLSHILCHNFASLVYLWSIFILRLFQLVLVNQLLSSLSLGKSFIVKFIISCLVWFSVLNNLHWVHLLVSSLTIKNLLLVVNELLSSDTHTLELLVDKMSLSIIKEKFRSIDEVLNHVELFNNIINVDINLLKILMKKTFIHWISYLLTSSEVKNSAEYLEQVALNVFEIALTLNIWANQDIIFTSSHTISEPLRSLTQFQEMKVFESVSKI